VALNTIKQTNNTVCVVQSKSSSEESTIKQLVAGSNVQDSIPETINKNLNFQKNIPENACPKNVQYCTLNCERRQISKCLDVMKKKYLTDFVFVFSFLRILMQIC
jgi:hypothetical protein